MNAEEIILELHMEKLASGHLIHFTEILENGITGGDQLWQNFENQRIVSPLYNYILGQQMIAFMGAVNVLHEKQQGGQDLSIEEIYTNLLYLFRGQAFAKLGRSSLERERKDPNTIFDKTFWNALEVSLSESEVMLTEVSSNLILVLVDFAGENWQARMPKVVMCYEFYSNYWNKHANFK